MRHETTTLRYCTTPLEASCQNAYNVNYWVLEAYRIIEITGGKDATNIELIEWLQENATQIL